MGLFKAKHMDKVVAGAISAGDKLFFTNEEKADYSKGIADAQMEFVKTSVSENSIRSITRRLLSISIVLVFLSLILWAVIIGYWDLEYSKYVFEVAKELFALVMMVAGFFFGGYMVKNNILPAFNKNRRSKYEK